MRSLWKTELLCKMCLGKSRKPGGRGQGKRDYCSEATDLAEKAQIRENPDIESTMHVMTGKEPISLGQGPQDEQNTMSTKIEAAITAPQIKAMTAPQIKVMTVPQIVMMNATCNT